MIIIMGALNIAPSEVSALLTDAKFLVSNTRTKKGCLFYSINLENLESGRIIIAERWQDQASLSAHIADSDTIAFIEKWGSKISGSPKKYDAINERELLE